MQTTKMVAMTTTPSATGATVHNTTTNISSVPARSGPGARASGGKKERRHVTDMAIGLYVCM